MKLFLIAASLFAMIFAFGCEREVGTKDGVLQLPEGNSPVAIHCGNKPCVVTGNIANNTYTVFFEDGTSWDIILPPNN